MSLAPVCTASARVVASQLFVSVYVRPGDGVTSGIGHQVASVLFPPMRRIGVCPGATLRMSRTSTGLIARGFEPVSSRTAVELEREAEEPRGERLGHPGGAHPYRDAGRVGGRRRCRRRGCRGRWCRRWRCGRRRRGRAGRHGRQQREHPARDQHKEGSPQDAHPAGNYLTVRVRRVPTPPARPQRRRLAEHEPLDAGRSRRIEVQRRQPAQDASMPVRASRRARWTPRHTCGPWANARWPRAGGRSRSRRSGSANTAGSRLAAAIDTRTSSPAEIRAPT